MVRKHTKLLLAMVALLLASCLTIVLLLVMPAQPQETQPTQSQQIVRYDLIITEVCTKNENLIRAADGRYRDYIELYNAGATVNLAGLRLSDGKTISQPLTDTVLKTGEYTVIFLANELTGFALGAAGGDQLQLLDVNGNIVQQLVTVPLAQDQVMLYGSNGYTVSDQASPGFSNDERGVQLFRYGEPETSPKLVISELLMNNRYTLPDENLQYSDVVELQNISDQPLSLGQYYLADGPDSRYDYRLPDVLVQPGEFVLIWCDGGDYVSATGEIHVPFGISFGEMVYLTTLQHRYVSLEAVSAGIGRSCSRMADGSYTDTEVSLGYANDADGIACFAASRLLSDSPLVINEVLLSDSGIPYNGHICDAVEIRNRSSQTVNTQGWYLSDGEDRLKYALPAMELAAGEYLVIICDSQTTGFSLSEKDALRLTDPKHYSTVPVQCLHDHFSRHEVDGHESYGVADVTLGFDNTQESREAYLSSQLGGLWISEMMTNNNSHLPGPYGTTCDWVELYNASDRDILLSDYYLSDDAEDLLRCRLPAQVLPAGEYCVIFLSKDDKNLRPGYPVLPIALSAAGETLYLSSGEGIEDYVQTPALQVDMSYGRPAGSAGFAVLAEVTVEKANAEAAHISSKPLAQVPQGVYADVPYLDIAFIGEGDIYYTTDCTLPNGNSLRYTEPVRITQTTVFRVVCIADGKRPSQVLDLTYVVNEGDKLDVVTLVTDPAALFDPQKGLYGQALLPEGEWAATVSLFTSNGGFSVPCGVKLAQSTAAGQLKKSLACVLRGRYGLSELEYPLFGEGSPDTYTSFELYSGGQDAFSSRILEALLSSALREKTGLMAREYRPVVVYLNGEYYGIHYIRQQLGEELVAGNAYTATENVTFCQGDGYNSADYRALLQYALTHDLSQQEYYDFVCSQVDLESYMDYIIALLYMGNVESVEACFYRTAGGKWTWMLCDADGMLRNMTDNSVSACLDPLQLADRDPAAKTLAVCLMQNETFVSAFLSRMAWQLQEIWDVEAVLAQISRLEIGLRQDMQKDCDRWEKNVAIWQGHVQNLGSFVRGRKAYLVTFVQDFFGLTEEEMMGYGFSL